MSAFMLRLFVIGAMSLASVIVGFTEGCHERPKGTQTMNSNPERFEHAYRDEGLGKATFAAGCFWGVESAFRDVEGVVDTQVGYTGGHTEDPTYEQVCSDTTGHAETVEVLYDPDVVTYEELLQTFWSIHNPTQYHRQGPDVGSQYRSAIFYHTPEQRDIAERSRQALDESGKYARPVTTEITEASEFYRAEEYHQQYAEKRDAACRRPDS